MRRPMGIWAVVALQVAMAMTLLPGMAATFPGVSPIVGVELTDAGRGIYISWAVVNVLAALWLWTLSRRGWVLTMVLVGIGLFTNLALWWYGEPNWLRMGIQAATAIYLNSAPVRDLFMRRKEIVSIVMRDSEAG